VHQAGERALEQLALAEDLDAFTRDPARDVAAPLDRAAEPHETGEQPGSSGGQAPGDHHEHGEEAGTHEHRREHTPPRRSGPPARQEVVAEAEKGIAVEPGIPQAGTKLISTRSRFYIRSH
jgi:hypothetical protein